MESPRKFNDCYFYYYSTCTKGDNCVFRHEPSALGCETMCVQWQQGKCVDKHCKLRHMELRKNRKQIPCYWESQPGGCRKKHCPFQHKNPEARTDGILPSQPIPPPNKSAAAPVSAAVDAEPVLAAAPVPPAAPHPVHPAHPTHAPHPAHPASMVVPHHEMMWQQQRGPVVLDSAILGVLPPTDMLGRRVQPAPHEPQYAALPVDPLVVNFEEESDNESAPSSTPTKMVYPEEGAGVAGPRGNKAHELLLLEQIQAASAAYYSYDSPVHYERRSLDELVGRPRAATAARASLDFKILSLDEIRARKRAGEPARPEPHDAKLARKRKLSAHETILAPNKVIKVVRNNSVVYKKCNGNVAQLADARNVPEDLDGRKRTFSVESDFLSINDDELDDSLRTMSTNLPPNKISKLDLNEKPKEIKLKLIHTNSETEVNSYDIQIDDKSLEVVDSCSVNESRVDESNCVVDLEFETIDDNSKEFILLSDEDSKLESDDVEEVAIVDSPIQEVSDKNISNGEIDHKKSNHYEGVKEIIDLDQTIENNSNDSITPEIEQSLRTVIVPDVVASCHSEKFNMRLVQNDSILNEIDNILNKESL